MATLEIKVPDIGDFKDVPVIEILVKAGDPVKKEASLVTLESDKATMEVPSTHSGTVAAVLVKVGDKVSQGTPIVTLEARAAFLLVKATMPGRYRLILRRRLAASRPSAGSSSSFPECALQRSVRPSPSAASEAYSDGWKRRGVKPAAWSAGQKRLPGFA